MNRSCIRSAVLVVTALTLGAVPPRAASPLGQGGIEPPVPYVPPNIIVIVLDDVGIDKLAMYGQSPGTPDTAPYDCPPSGPFTTHYGYPSTPNLQNLANGNINGAAIRFTRAYANPVCSPTRACLMTGRYGFRTGMGLATSAMNPWSVADEEKFVPELLKTGVPNGPYKCGAFGKWHMTTPGDYDHATRNGFDIFQGSMANNTRGHFLWDKVTSYPNGPTTTGMVTTFDATVTTDDALAWIAARTEPFFAYIAYNAPHEPYQVPPLALLSGPTQSALTTLGNCAGPYAERDFAKSRCTAQFAGCLSDDTCSEPLATGCEEWAPCYRAVGTLFYNALLEAVDSEIGRLIATIDAEKLANTMIFVIGDNGTPSPVIDASHECAHSKQSVYEWGTHVPLIVSGPLVPSDPSDPTPLSRECSGLVHAVDLWRTLRDISGANEAGTNPLVPLDSVSFYSLITNPNSAGARQYVFSQYFVSNGPYTPTSIGPYDADQDPPCADPVPDDDCVMLELAAHTRSITNGVYRYVRTQVVAPDDGSPQGTPDTQPTYVQQVFNLTLDIEEQNDLYPSGLYPPGVIQGMINYMTALSGF